MSQFPVRLVKTSTLDELRAAKATTARAVPTKGEERAPTRKAKPKPTCTGPAVGLPRTKPQRKADRQFVDAAVTPHYLVGLLDGKTTAQADAASREYVGWWMTVTASLRGITKERAQAIKER